MNCEVTYDKLTAFAAGDLDEKGLAEIREHSEDCHRCTKRLEIIQKADSVLSTLLPVFPPPSTVLAARRAISEVTRNVLRPEIMTLEEVAEFLRITPDELGEIAEDLPAFELAGQIRIRRTRLIEWIQQRERDYTHDAAAGWTARSESDGFQIGIA